MPGELKKKGLLILDRDGVINRDSREFVKSADDWQPLAGSIVDIAQIWADGYNVAIASKQSGLAGGLFDKDALQAMHQKLRDLVAAAGGEVGRIVVCPHGPYDGCDCRKPRPGLLLELAKHYETALDGVPVVGDSLRDLQAAVAAGARPILVRTGNGEKTEQRLPPELTNVEISDDLAAVASMLVAE